MGRSEKFAGFLEDVSGGRKGDAHGFDSLVDGATLYAKRLQAKKDLA
jgi:hypothetical protein